MTTKKHTVKFKAIKTVNTPVDVEFETKSGKKVDFPAHKPVKKKVKAEFKAADRKR
jgi:hypothetical protein